MTFTIQQYFYNLYKNAQRNGTGIQYYIESDYNNTDFANNIKKYVSFSSTPINKDLTLTIDYEYSKEPFGIYYIEVNGNIQKIDILKYGYEEKVLKNKNAILYYSDNVKIKNKTNIDFSIPYITAMVVILVLSIFLIISIIFKQTTKSLTYATLLIFSFLAETSNICSNRHKKNTDKEKHLLELGKTLKELSICYDFLFLYNHYNIFSIQNTEYILNNKFDEFKKHPHFY